MSEQGINVYQQPIASQEETLDFIGKLADIAHSNAVVSDPISEHGHTAIVVSEVMTSLGAGFGSGPSSPTESPGGGGGGGGFSMSRPVALIQIGPNGVRQESLFDATKVGLATVVTIGSILLTWFRLKHASK